MSLEDSDSSDRESEDDGHDPYVESRVDLLGENKPGARKKERAERESTRVVERAKEREERRERRSYLLPRSDEEELEDVERSRVDEGVGSWEIAKRQREERVESVSEMKDEGRGSVRLTSDHRDSFERVSSEILVRRILVDIRVRLETKEKVKPGQLDGFLRFVSFLGRGSDASTHSVEKRNQDVEEDDKSHERPRVVDAAKKRR